MKSKCSWGGWHTKSEEEDKNEADRTTTVSTKALKAQSVTLIAIVHMLNRASICIYIHVIDQLTDALTATTPTLTLDYCSAKSQFKLPI